MTKTFDPNILIGHCDPISRFSDFALYLGTEMVYELNKHRKQPCEPGHENINMTHPNQYVLSLHVK